ncbi:MAG TPA: NUDIX domain-containing protein [Pirellulales bacterium]|jgi:8-oxo-dGTP diphosphatase
MPPPRRGAVAVIVRDDCLLVICRAKCVVAPGAFCFPGGHIEENETEEQALVRELREELDALVRPIRRVWQSVSPSGVELNWWFAEIDTACTPTPNPSEVESIHWMTPSELAMHPKTLESNRLFMAALRAGDARL